jgi:hypothetical protein
VTNNTWSGYTSDADKDLAKLNGTRRVKTITNDKFRLT